MNRVQAELRFVQILLHAAAGEQFPVTSVRPLVIGTDQSRRVAGRLGANQRAAMAADIVQAANRSVVAANYDKGISIHL